MRTAGSFFFCYVMNWGIIGIWMGVVADQLSRLILGSVRFKKGRWMKIKI
jgi:Na+-driven multidrug efflux pump